MKLIDLRKKRVFDNCTLVAKPKENKKYLPVNNFENATHVFVYTECKKLPTISKVEHFIKNTFINRLKYIYFA